ncbi:MAG: hypothetical protein ACRELB_21840 [Polyangiaceae bacterium]
MLRPVPRCVLAATLLGLVSREALAEGPTCGEVAVEVDPAVEARWPQMPRRIREAFEAHHDFDRCARITVASSGDAIELDVSLPDGRSARRSILRPTDVIPALEALLIVPEIPRAHVEGIAPAPPGDGVESPADTPLPTPSPRPTLAIAPAREATTPAVPPPSRSVGIELSVYTGTRVGDGRASIGLGALSFLDFSGWLVGIAVRADHYETLGGAPSAHALEPAVLGGRRIRLGTMALDLVGGPALALGGQSTYETVSPAGDRTSASASNTVPRLLAEARLAFSAPSTAHAFVAVDGDFGAAITHDASLLPDVPRLPVWTLGLALGATVGTP